MLTSYNFNSECICDSNAEPDEEVDLLEPELDEDDAFQTELNGDAFLIEYILDSIQVESPIRNLSCLCRPITPKRLKPKKDNYTMCGLTGNQCAAIRLEVLAEELSDKVSMSSSAGAKQNRTVGPVYGKNGGEDVEIDEDAEADEDVEVDEDVEIDEEDGKDTDEESLDGYAPEKDSSSGNEYLR